MHKPDLKSKRFGAWFVLGLRRKRTKAKHRVWNVICLALHGGKVCGRKGRVDTGNLTYGTSTNCGCLRRRRGQSKTYAARFEHFTTPGGISKKHAWSFGRCLLWIGALDQDGYGRIEFLGSTRPATHLAWFLKYGVLPTLNLCHTCDVPACVEERHLFEGTVSDNVYDRDVKKQGGVIVEAPRGPRSEAHVTCS